ncbi:MAG: hypothetical protein JSU63_16720 [Phycisphaerales bacterium]|nr:MAG: hypothetical protein JSU63_16720 [Phycisphaerales bacterium]
MRRKLFYKPERTIPVIFLTPLCVLVYSGLVHAQAVVDAHPLASSVAENLPMPDEGEWDTLTVSPDGTKVYFGDAWARIVVIDTADDSVLNTIELAEDGFIGGIAFSPEGRLFVNTENAFWEFDPDTHAVVNQSDVPWIWHEGMMTFSPNGQTMYVAGEWDIHVLDIADGALSFVDTTPGDGEINGLLAANPSWEPNFHRAREIAMSPDGDRLYVLGDDPASDFEGTALHTIDGLAGGTVTAPLTLSLYEIPSMWEGAADIRMVLSEDGTLLFDSQGNTWDTTTMTVLRTVALDEWSFGPAMLSRAPNGAFMYFEGWGGTYGGADETTYGGEQILVASGSDYQLIDLDDVTLNGMTGIELPRAGGAYNNHEMAITPDGEKLYIAAGSSGAIVVDLAVDEQTGLVVPDSGGDDGTMTVRIVGDFEEGMSAALTREGQDDIVGTDTTVSAEGTLETHFDLTDQPLGLYDVVVTSPDSTVLSLADAFTIEEAHLGATVDVMGLLWLSLYDDANIAITAQNTGNVELTDLIVSLKLTEDTQYKLDLPAAVEGGEGQTDEEYTTSDGVVPEYVWIAKLAPYERYTFRLDVAGPEGVAPIYWDIELEATVGFVQASDDTSSKDATCESAIGDLCTIVDALVKNINAELKRRGHDVPEGEMDDVVREVIKKTVKDFGVAKLTGMAAKALGEAALRALIPEAMPLWDLVFGAISDIKSCLDMLKRLLGFSELYAFDPNDKVSGTGIDGFILGTESLQYVIHFENLPEATAAARHVTITDQLDDRLDYSTFTVEDSSHPDVLTCELDEATGLVTFTFSDIELPPNGVPPEGQGYVAFSIRPQEGLESGTQIGNDASIVFDINDPIETPEVVHTIDTAPPTCSVDPLEETTEQETFTVSWSGDDAGVGIWDYTVYVSVDDGDYTAWLEETEETSAEYTGQVDSTYRFYAVARDRLGNTSSIPSEAQARTTVVAGDDDTPSIPRGCGSGGCGAAGMITWPMIMCGLYFLRATKRRCGSTR